MGGYGNEIWKDIEELDLDYQISNKGRIKSKPRIVTYNYQGGYRSRKVIGKILKGTIKKKGDRIDSIQYNIRGKTILPSLLVYKYFISDKPIEDGYCIAHKDKNPLNNCVENLIKVTWSESKVIDHQNSERTIKAQLDRSKRGVFAIKMKKIKFFKPKKNMFYITKKDTETGKKFQEIVKKREKAFDEQEALSKKYGFKQWRPAYWVVWGGMSSCLDFEETPDKKIWGKGAKDGEYFPKRNSKKGKEIYKEIEDLYTVSILELNQCIGFKEHAFKTIGFAFNNNEYFGFITNKDWGITPPEDCKEVTETEYDKLFES